MSGGEDAARSMPASVRWLCGGFLGLIGVLGLGKTLLLDPPTTHAEQPAHVAPMPFEEVTLDPAAQSTASEPVAPTTIQPLISPSQRTEQADAPNDPPPSAPEPSSVQKLIQVNTASAAELELLPRIGPVMAQRIIEDRAANGPYRDADDLQRVRGIGPKTAEKHKPLVGFEMP